MRDSCGLDCSTMTIVDGLTEPLISGELMTTSSVFTAAENHSGHGLSKSTHDEKDSWGWVWAEVRVQLWLAGPIMAMYMLQYIMSLANVVFVGHLGSLPLAAFTLANAFSSMTGYTVLAGMASALETLCGQAYGGKQYHLLGIFLQRAVFILAATSVPIALIWLNMGRILVSLGEDPVVVGAAQFYIYWSLPILLLYAVLNPLVKFFQTQHAVFQLMVSMAVATLLIHVPLCWLVIDKLGVGLPGAAIVYIISNSLHMCILFSFVRFSPRFHKTFSSFSWEAFHDVGEFLSLAVPSATMMCLDNWSYEILTLLAGLLPNSRVSISTFTICIFLLALSNMISMALGVATSVRVSNELGAGNADTARSAFAVSVGIGLVDGTVMASLIYSLRHKWGWAFTSDAEVVQDVACTAPYLAVIALLYVIGANLSGVVRGVGWQRAGAIANLGAYYAVGLPVAFISVFVFKFDTRGLWLGMGCGLLTQIVALISILLWPSWDRLAQEALLRSHSFNSQLPTLAGPLLKPIQEDGILSEDLLKPTTEA